MTTKTTTKTPGTRRLGDLGAAALSLLIGLGALSACDSLEPADGAGSKSATKTSRHGDDAAAAAAAAAEDKRTEAAPKTPTSTPTPTTATPTARPGAPTTVGPRTSAEVAKHKKILADYRDCAGGCLADTSRSKTDRETCRLTCQGTAESSGIDLKAPSHQILDHFNLCLETCFTPETSDANRETCQHNCDAVSEILATTLDFSTPTAAPASPGSAVQAVDSACARSCIQQLTRCERICDGQRKSETNEATCRLLCAANGEICVDTCNITAAGL